MITRADLDRVFREQHQLTTNAINEGAGLESYLTNLGFAFQDVYDWVYEYTLGNSAQREHDWNQKDIILVSSLLTRALAMGLLLGRESKP